MIIFLKIYCYSSAAGNRIDPKVEYKVMGDQRIGVVVAEAQNRAVKYHVVDSTVTSVSADGMMTVKRDGK